MITLISILSFIGWTYNFIQCLKMIGTPLNQINVPKAIKIGGIFLGYGAFLGWLEIFKIVD